MVPIVPDEGCALTGPAPDASAASPRIVVTGATGLIGTHLIGSLTNRSRVWALARAGHPESAGHVTWVAQDLARSLEVTSLPAEADAVVHLAQSPHFREFPAGAADVFEVNVGSTARLLDWAVRARVRTFILASSGGVYGADERTFHEDDPLPLAGTLGHYLATRTAAEGLARSYSAHFNVVVLRFFFVYGPGQRADMLVPRLVASVKAGRVVTLRGPDGLRFNPTHARDAAAAVESALSLASSETVNVAGPRVLSLREAVEAIGSAVGRSPAFEVVPSNRSEDIVGDIGKMRRLLRAPEVSFEEGVRELA